MAGVDVETSPLRSSRSLVLAVLGGVAVTALLPGTRRPLWLDEAASASLAALPGESFRQVVLHREGNGIAHTLLLRGWRHVASGDLGLRVPSLVLSALAVLALTSLALTLFDRRTALLVPPLLVGNPLYVRYAVEARTYALVLLLSCLSGTLLVRALRRDTVAGWALYALLTGAAVYAHYFALLLPLGHGVAVLLRRAPLPRSRGLLAGAAVYLVVVSGLAALLNGAGASGVGYLENSPLLKAAIPGSLAVGFLATAAGVAVVLRRRSQGHPVVLRAGPSTWPWLLVGSWLVCPAVAAVLVSVLLTPVLAPRYLVICLPPAVLLLAAALARLPWTAVTAVITALVTLAGLLVGDRYVQSQTEDWPQAAEAVASRAVAGDGVLFAAPYVRLPFERHWPGEAEQRRGVDPLLPDLPWGASPTELFFDVPLPRERVATALAGRQRVWLVLSHVNLYGQADPVLDGVNAALRSVMTMTSERAFRGVSVQVWERSAAP
ncbi:MAG: glycosyltransferase family 39 protein [Frankiaceae bacterium]|nr:glycosyltransferase family 39 protein [Frankiaceae bacterium]